MWLNYLLCSNFIYYIHSDGTKKANQPQGNGEDSSRDLEDARSDPHNRPKIDGNEPSDMTSVNENKKGHDVKVNENQP